MMIVPAGVKVHLALGYPAVTQTLERPELIKRMHADAFVILSEGIILGDPTVTDNAGDRLRLRHPLLLHQQFERPVASSAGGYFEHAGLVAIGVDDRPHTQALEQGALGDALCQLLDRDAGLHAPDVGLAEHQLVEGNIAGRAEFDFLNGVCHVGYSTTGGRETLSRPPTRHRRSGSPLTL